VPPGLPTAALCAGLVFAILPAVSVQGHNARPYALVTAAATWASYLLLRAVAGPRPRRFAAYGLALALTGYLHLFDLLLVPAHTITLMSLRRPASPARRGSPLAASPQPATGRILVVRRWLVTIAAVAAAMVPAGILGWLQRGQIWWIPNRAGTRWPPWPPGSPPVRRPRPA
jgi:mannosyltransferase